MAELNNGALDAALLASFGIHNNQIICDTAEILQVQEIVRVLPSTRLVCKCLFNGKPVYVKLFIGLRANIHAAREAGGIMLLQNVNILTPNLLLQTTTNSQPVLVFEAIKNAINAEVFMCENDFLTRKSMAKKLAQNVAQHHNANLLQTDIHLKNFLIANTDIAAEEIYTIDGDGIVQTNSQKKKRQNLATFLSKFDALDDDFMHDSVEAYYLAINQKFTLDDFVKTYFLTQKIRQKAASDYADIKVFRTCTDVAVTENTQHFLAVSSQFNIDNQQLENLDNVLNEPANNIKNGNTCTIGMMQIAGKQVVIKRYNDKSFWHGVKFLFKQKRAAKSWANAHRLKIYNIATPQPLALVIEKSHFIGNKSYFLSEFVDAPDIAEFFAAEKTTELKQLVAHNVARLFYKMSLLKIVHGDCKASNFKIKNGLPMALDLDSMIVAKSYLPYTYQHVKDLKRFMQNWQNDAETTKMLKNAFKLCYEIEDDYFAIPNALDQAGIV